jgi:cell division protein FtsI/penicillin-binding protein 2
LKYSRILNFYLLIFSMSKNGQSKYRTDYRKLSKNKTPEKNKKGFWESGFLAIFKGFKKTKQNSKPALKTTKKRIFNNPQQSLAQSLFKFLVYIFTFPFLLIFTPFWKMGEVTVGVLSVRQNYLKVVFSIIFVVIIFRFAQLQLLANDSQFAVQADAKRSRGEIVVSRRGQIFIQDISQSKNNIAVTTTQSQIEIFADAGVLKSLIVKKDVNLQDLVIDLSSSLNLPYSETFSKIQSETQKDQPSSYLVLKSGVTDAQRNAVVYLRSSQLNDKYSFGSWLGISEKQTRSYPENKLLSATIGYVPPFLETESEINSRIKSCGKMVEENNLRGTSTGEYMVGFYGLEQKYCSELGGVNGIRQFGFSTGEEKNVINGADVYTTIDKNIQQKAEQILEQTFRDQTNANGTPKDGTIIVMEVETGKIRAMASYPNYDPNDYQKYWAENPSSFRNVATNVDYDIGSVMKPITVASALNIYQSGYTENGVRKGIAPDFAFTDYPASGKIYTTIDGKANQTVRNSDNSTFIGLGKIGLKEIIRDSINTGIADIVDATGARKLEEYWEDRFKFGKQTQINLPGDYSGNINNFEADKNCPFCYANFGFGQGFTATPMQVVRAYTPIANDGYLVEPVLVEKIVYKDGTVDDGTSPNSSIPRQTQQQVITPTVARQVTTYMQAVVDEGYKAVGRSPAGVDGYSVAAKTGTSEVNRPYMQLDADKKPVLDEKGEPIMIPCSYQCNRERGRFDQTLIGFAPAKDPKYLVMIKLSEPKPGEVKNFSSVTLSKPFSDMMGYTLTYMGVPREY